MAASFVPGTVCAGYVIERVLGVGGMGTVYVARHPRLPRREALKVLSREYLADPEFHARFLREAELVARLDHPNIVAVHDRGVFEGQPWIAMQFVEGTDAAALVRAGPAALPVQRVLHIVGSVASGLDAAHRAGMVHRDVKPANILIELRPGRPDQVYISDFGIGRSTDRSTALTEPGSVLGTLSYAAPEQITGAVVDHRADVYALGVTMYELLTGAKPFRGPGLADLMRAHLELPPPRPSAAVPTLPPAIDGVIATAMAKNPAERFPSCGALAAAAAAALGADIPHRAGPAPVPPRPRGRAVRFGPALGALALAVVAVATLLTRCTPGGADSAHPPATTAPPVTTASASWGQYQFMVDALPGLLPAGPVSAGHQGLRCVPQNRYARPVELSEELGPVGFLSCNGDRDPLARVEVMCRTDRFRATISPLAPGEDGTVTYDAEWTRGTGSGRVVLIDLTGPGGEMRIQFEDPYRNFCLVNAYGGTSGRDLYDRWWPEIPW